MGTDYTSLTTPPHSLLCTSYIIQLINYGIDVLKNKWTKSFLKFQNWSVVGMTPLAFVVYMYIHHFISWQINSEGMEHFE